MFDSFPKGHDEHISAKGWEISSTHLLFLIKEEEFKPVPCTKRHVEHRAGSRENSEMLGKLKDYVKKESGRINEQLEAGILQHILEESLS